MATKKTASSTSHLEVKTTKTSEKAAKSAIAVTQSLLDQASSCCSSALDSLASGGKKETKSSEKSGLPMTSSPEKSGGCCMGTTSCGTSVEQFAQKHTTTASPGQKVECKKGPKTRIIVRYDVGFNNTLSLRGKGANLSWDKGTLLKNVKPDEWIWETESSFNTCEFKVLINDTQYEIGENHPLSCGASIQYTPKF